MTRTNRPRRNDKWCIELSRSTDQYVFRKATTVTFLSVGHSLISPGALHSISFGRTTRHTMSARAARHSPRRSLHRLLHLLISLVRSPSRLWCQVAADDQYGGSHARVHMRLGAPVHGLLPGRATVAAITEFAEESSPADEVANLFIAVF